MDGAGKERKMATAQRGRSRSCAFAYSRDRPDPKIHILSGASLHRRAKGMKRNIQFSIFSEIITGTACKLLNRKTARSYTSKGACKSQFKMSLLQHNEGFCLEAQA